MSSELVPPARKKLKGKCPYVTFLYELETSLVNDNTLTTDLWSKRQNDVVFSVGGREFPAHRMVLASQSEYFRVMLYGDMKEASMSNISLPEEIVPPSAFEKVLQYCYTKSLEIDEPLEVRRDLLSLP